MRTKLTLLATFVAALICGCSSGGPMVGTWKMELTDEMKKMAEMAGGSIDGSMEFKGDGTFTGTMKMTSQGKTETSTVEGTYKVDGKNLTMTLTKMDGKDPSESDKKPETVTLADDMKSFSAPKVPGMKFVKQ